jgi:hypothetical protein
VEEKYNFYNITTNKQYTDVTKKNICSKNLLTFCVTKSRIDLSEVMVLKKMGRPKDNNKEIGYTIRMDDAMLRRLELYCEKMGMLKSQAIREAINALPIDENDDK